MTEGIVHTARNAPGLEFYTTLTPFVSLSLSLTVTSKLSTKSPKLKPAKIAGAITDDGDGDDDDVGGILKEEQENQDANKKGVRKSWQRLRSSILGRKGSRKSSSSDRSSGSSSGRKSVDMVESPPTEVSSSQSPPEATPDSGRLERTPSMIENISSFVSSLGGGGAGAGAEGGTGDRAGAIAGAQDSKPSEDHPRLERTASTDARSKLGQLAESATEIVSEGARVLTAVR
jgi:hypothetical protein